MYSFPPLKKNKSSIPDEQLPYRVVSVSLPKPKQPDHREYLNVSNANVQQASAVLATTTLNQTLGKQDASVEARISLDLGIEVMTQTDNDNVTLAEKEEPKATGEEQIDESPSQKTYNERLKSLSKELAEIRLLFERACSK